MNGYEEELQRNIETGKPVKGEESDIRAYQEVFRALKTAPVETFLSRDFADRIVARVLEKQKRESRKDMLWFIAGIFLMVLVLAATIWYTGFKIDMGFLNNMSAYTGLAIFGVAFIVFLNILEKRIMLKKDMN